MSSEARRFNGDPGQRISNELAPQDPFTVTTPNGKKVPIRDLTDLELKLAIDSFRAAEIRSVQQVEASRQLWFQASNMCAILSFELDRRGRVSLHG